MAEISQHQPHTEAQPEQQHPEQTNPQPVQSHDVAPPPAENAPIQQAQPVQPEFEVDTTVCLGDL